MAGIAFTVIRIRLTVGTLVACGTPADVGAVFILTSPTVLTRAQLHTLINVQLAQFTIIARWTLAGEADVILVSHTVGTMLALVGQTRVEFHVTVPTCVLHLTDTLVAVDSVQTIAMLTRVALAFIDVCLTVPLSISQDAVTVVGVILVVTRGAMLTWITITFVDLFVTPVAFIAIRTHAVKPVNTVHTVSSNTGVRITFIDVGGTLEIIVSMRTVTVEAVHLVYTGATMTTG